MADPKPPTTADIFSVGETPTESPAPADQNVYLQPPPPCAVDLSELSVVEELKSLHQSLMQLTRVEGYGYHNAFDVPQNRADFEMFSRLGFRATRLKVDCVNAAGRLRAIKSFGFDMHQAMLRKERLEDVGSRND